MVYLTNHLSLILGDVMGFGMLFSNNLFGMFRYSRIRNGRESIIFGLLLLYVACLSTARVSQS